MISWSVTLAVHVGGVRVPLWRTHNEHLVKTAKDEYIRKLSKAFWGRNTPAPIKRLAQSKLADMQAWESLTGSPVRPLAKKERTR